MHMLFWPFSFSSFRANAVTRRILLALTVAIAATLTACSWVKTSPEADRVEIRQANDLRGCERIGQTTTSVRDRVAGVQRRPGTVEEELADLARNSAVEIGGNALVVDSPVRDGQQRFLVYRCR